MNVRTNRLVARVARLACAALVVLGTTGCPSGSTTNVVDCDGGRMDSSVDSGAGDSGAPHDSGTPVDSGAAPDAGGADTSVPPNPGVVYNDVTSASNWSSFDLSTLVDAGIGDAGPGGGYITAAFDGRYVYFVPGTDGVVVRYDSLAPFALASSWTSFDVGAVEVSAGGFRGAAFDGRYVYLVPYFSAPSTLGGVALRYDTHADFGATSSWQDFDITTVDPACTGLFGATFDGRYVTMAPYGQDSAPEGHAARFDTWGSFTDPAAWATFNTAILGAHDVGFLGASFDGRYVYLSPYAYQLGSYGSLVTRFDSWGSFDDPGAWSSFDTTTVSPRALGYFGTSFDGRYTYFVPYFGDGATGGLVSRYDTTQPFGAPGSWSTFDVSALGVAPAGAVFDGRFLYLVPSALQGQASGTGSGVLARLDTTVDFASSSAWTTYDLTKINPDARGFYGGAFDGQHVYLVPSWHSVVMQFDAKSPPSMPDAYHGSFY